MKNRMLLRYMVSYALVLILPFLSVWLFFDRAMIRRFSEEITASNSHAVTQMRDTLDGNLEQLFNLAYVIQNTPSLNPKNIGADIVARRSAIAALGTYQSITPLPESIIVFRSGDKICYTGTTAITPEKLFTQQLVYASHSAEDFLRTIDAPESILFWPVDTVSQFGGQTMECLTVFISVGAGNVVPKQRTVFVLPVRRIADLIRTLAGADASVRIAGPGGETILDMGDDTLLRDSLPAADPEGRLSVGGKAYHLSTAESRIMGWSYTVLRPLDALEAPLRAYQRSVLLMAVLLLLAGGALVYLISWRTYRPLRNLAEKARSYAPGGNAGNEMEQVEAVLESLSSESRSYRVMLENSTESLRQNCLTRLLSDPAHAEALLKELRGYSVLTDPEALCRVVVLEKKLLSACPAQSMIENLLAVSLEVTDALVCENPPDPELLALILQYGASTAGSEEEMLLFQSRLEEESGQPVFLGISQTCSAAGLGEAYRQAVYASRTRLFRGSSAAVFYTPANQSDESIREYPVQELEALQWNLLQRDPEKIKECLERIADRLSRSSVSVEMARMVCYDAINVTIRTLLSGQGEAGLKITPGTLEQLAAFESVQELTDSLTRLVREACAAESDRPEGRPDDRGGAMKAYVRENCFSADFSLQMAADHFGLTPSNFSHYFKNCTGTGLSEYVQEQRRNEACRLLTTTDAPIQEIGRQIGMPNVSSFIRSFRQQTGLTPGQYRARNGKAAGV